MKTCTKCGEIKAASDYYSDLRREDKLYPHCKSCHSVYTGTPEAIARRREYAKSKRGQELHRIGSRKYRQTGKGRASAIRSAITSRKRYAERARASVLVSNAIRDGKLSRPEAGWCCGGIPVQGHHVDYSEPLSVVWLCHECHRQLHKAA